MPSLLPGPTPSSAVGPIKRPDVQVVDRQLIRGQRIMGTPALVVEIASPSTAVLDRTEKRIAYAEAGIPAYWLVDSDAETITVLVLEDSAYFERPVIGIDDAVEVEHPTTFVLAGRAVFAPWPEPVDVSPTAHGRDSRGPSGAL